MQLKKLRALSHELRAFDWYSKGYKSEQLVAHSSWLTAKAKLSYLRPHVLPPYPRIVVLFPAGRRSLFFDEHAENRL